MLGIGHFYFALTTDTAGTRRTSPLPARTARICARLVASESSMLTINTQHRDLPFRLILRENPGLRLRLILHEKRVHRRALKE